MKTETHGETGLCIFSQTVCFLHLPFFQSSHSVIRYNVDLLRVLGSTIDGDSYGMVADLDGQHHCMMERSERVLVQFCL